MKSTSGFRVFAPVILFAVIGLIGCAGISVDSGTPGGGASGVGRFPTYAAISTQDADASSRPVRISLQGGGTGVLAFGSVKAGDVLGLIPKDKPIINSMTGDIDELDSTATGQVAMQQFVGGNLVAQHEVTTTKNYSTLGGQGLQLKEDILVPPGRYSILFGHGSNPGTPTSGRFHITSGLATLTLAAFGSAFDVTSEGKVGLPKSLRAFLPSNGLNMGHPAYFVEAKYDPAFSGRTSTLDIGSSSGLISQSRPIATGTVSKFTKTASYVVPLVGLTSIVLTQE